VVWDVSSVTAGEDKDTSTFVLINRQPRPPRTLPDADRQTWESLVNGRMPYTGAAFFDKSHTVIATAYSPQEAKGDPAKLTLLYSVAYSVEGTQDASLMEKKLGRFREGIQVNGR